APRAEPLFVAVLADTAPRMVVSMHQPDLLRVTVMKPWGGMENRSLDIVRRTREEPDVDDSLAANLVDERAVPAAQAEARAHAHSVRECLEELDAEQRQTIALAFFHGLTHSELAAHLRRPLGTVKTHVRRGLAKLRDCLMRNDPDAAERG
ncbi:MAG TPA: sigma-70 family RNA polymerase sigma factor, partial [Usitatibacter sp.]